MDDPFEGLVVDLDLEVEIRPNRSRFGSYIITQRQLRLDRDEAGFVNLNFSPPQLAPSLLPVTRPANLGNAAVTRPRRWTGAVCECGKQIYASRADACYCSGRCRMRAWRRSRRS